MNWHIGQKVVAVGAGKNHPPGKFGPGPKIGEVLTVSGIYTLAHWNGVIALLIAEYPEKHTGWWSGCFRPVIEADLSAELAETFLKGQPPSEQEVYNPQYA